MTEKEFEDFVTREGIEWQGDLEAIYFRDMSLPWYHKEGRALRVERKVLERLTVKELEYELCCGLKVEQITRVTGYMSKVNQWNPGKLGELKDRHREADNTLNLNIIGKH